MSNEVVDPVYLNISHSSMVVQEKKIKNPFLLSKWVLKIHTSLADLKPNTNIKMLIWQPYKNSGLLPQSVGSRGEALAPTPGLQVNIPGSGSIAYPRFNELDIDEVPEYKCMYVHCK